MPLIFLDGIDEPSLAPYRDLRNRATDSANPDHFSVEGHFIVEGRFCVEKLARSQWTTDSVVIQRGREAEMASWFPAATPIFLLSADNIKKLVGFDFHRGVLACGVRPPQRSVTELITGRITERSNSPILLAACGVSDRANLGSMIRTATAMGIGQLICDHRTVDPFSRRVIRTSMGTVLSQSIAWSDSLESDFRHLANNGGYRTIATTLSPDAISIDQFRVDDRPMILMVGNESTGLDRAVQAVATDRVTIPMQMATDSLNVSVSVCLNNLR